MQRSAILTFPKALVEKPVISTVIRGHAVEVNILRAHVTPDEDGRMFVILKGGEADVNRAIAYLRESGVRVSLPDSNLVWHEDRCVHCGACIGQCMTEALVLEPETGRVAYHSDRCIACGLCIPACGYGAIESMEECLARQGGL